MQFLDEKSTFDVNITQPFLQQAFRLRARWPEIERSLKDDFRYWLYEQYSLGQLSFIKP